MRKNIVFLTIAAVAILGSGKITYAASIGSPIKTLGQWKSSLAIEYDNILDRDLEGSGSTDAEIRTTNTFYAKGTLGFLDNLDAYFKLGGIDGEYKWTSGSTKIEEDFEYDIYWGGGVKASYQFYKNLYAFFDAQYNLWEAEIDNVKRNALDGTNESGDGKFREYQLSIGAAAEFTYQEYLTIIPYGGIKFSQFKLKNESIKYTVSSTEYTLNDELDAKDNFGIFIGADIQPMDYPMLLNIEGRFLDETALTVGLCYKF